MHIVATLWQNGQPVALSGPRYLSYADGINRGGDIVGQVSDVAALWHNGAMTLLSTPKGARSAALCINDSGQIVGVANLGPFLLTPWRSKSGSWPRG